MGEYFCDITSELDKLASINSDALRKHYVLVDNYCLNKKCLAIRIHLEGFGLMTMMLSQK